MAVSRQWELLRDFLRKTHNREVNEWFGDLEPGDEDFETGRKAARANSLIRPKESQNIALIKMINFYFNIQESHLKPDIYGIPVSTYKDSVKYLPQIIVTWQERKDIAKANNRRPLEAEHSIRYRGSIETAADIDRLKRLVRQTFTTPDHSFDKGRKSYNYVDWEKGHRLRVLAQSDTDAKSVINKMLELVGDNPLNEEFLHESKVNRNWTNINRVRIAGEMVKKPQSRTPGKLYFSHAVLSVHALKRDILLHSTGRIPVATRYR